MMSDKSNIIQLSLDNGVTWIDVTPYVKIESLNIDIRAMNDTFRCASNSASYEVLYSDDPIAPSGLTLHELIRNCNIDILTRILHWSPYGDTLGSSTLGSSYLGNSTYIDDGTGDGNSYAMFCGRAKPAISRTYNGIMNNTIIQLEFTDSSALLDVACGDIVYRKTITDSWYVYAPADTAHSIVHQLAVIAGFPLDKLSPDVTIAVELSAFAPESEEDSVYQLIDTLLHEHGYALSFDETDRILPIKWMYTGADLIYHEFTESDIGDPLNESVNPYQYEAAEVTFFELGSKDNVLVYRDGDLPYDPSGGFAGYSIPASYYYPIPANVIDDTTGTNQIVYQPYEDTGISYLTNKAVVNNLDINRNSVKSDFSSILATFGHVLEWQSSNAELGLVTETYYNKKARILLRNTGAVARDLYYLNIRASVIYRTSERKVKTYSGVIPKKLWKYTAQFINDNTTARTYTGAMMAQYTAKNVNYKFEALHIRSVGKLVEITLADGTNDKCLIMGRSYNQETKKWTYTLKRYNTTATTITAQSVYAFSAAVPEIAPYVGQYKGMHTGVPAMQKGDWFLYTGVTTGSLTYGKLYVST